MLMLRLKRFSRTAVCCLTQGWCSQDPLPSVGWASPAVSLLESPLQSVSSRRGLRQSGEMWVRGLCPVSSLQGDKVGIEWVKGAIRGCGEQKKAYGRMGDEIKLSPWKKWWACCSSLVCWPLPSQPVISFISLHTSCMLFFAVALSVSACKVFTLPFGYVSTCLLWVGSAYRGSVCCCFHWPHSSTYYYIGPFFIGVPSGLTWDCPGYAQSRLLIG